MGGLRLFLAFCVVAGHGPFFPRLFGINAGIAVFCFFVISGFYMAMVIDRKYRDLPRWRFFANRALRLYPGYFAALAFFVGAEFYISGSSTITSYQAPAPWGTLLPWLNFTIIGQDIFMVALDNGVQLPNSVMIQPAWSIAVELIFYGFAAFAFTSRRGVVALFVLAVITRMLWDHYGFETYGRFFAQSLIYFAAGGLAYLAYDTIKQWPTTVRALLALSMLIWMWLDYNTNWIMFYVTLAMAVPLLFSLTNHNRFDRFVGDLSYPVYLLHHGLLCIVAPLFDLSQTTLFLVITLLPLAALIVIAIEWPIEALRVRIVESSKKHESKFFSSMIRCGPSSETLSSLDMTTFQNLSGHRSYGHARQICRSTNIIMI